MGAEGEKIPSKEIGSGLNNVFLASTEYVNDLPDLSYNLKQFLYPFNLQKYSEYMTPQFAKNYVNDEFIGCDNAFGIDFINLGKYEQMLGQEMLELEDMKLLVDSNQNTKAKTRNQNHTKNIPWLRKTEYISAESVRNTKMSDMVDKKLIQNAEIYKKCTDSYKSLSAQVDAINSTFEDNKVDPALHANKPKHITPVKVIPILPNTELSSSSSGAHVTFDSHPTFYGSDKMIDQEDAANAILRGLSNQNEDFVGYYIPRKMPILSESILDSEKKLKFFQILREYKWNINSNSSNMDIYAFAEDSKSTNFEYIAVPSKIKLNKRLFSDHSIESSLTEIPHKNLIIEEMDLNKSPQDDSPLS